MSLRIYNTLSRQKEEFSTLEPGKVRFYVCGPTVYATAHIGHAMSALVFDIIRRYLEYSGYAVNFVMNYTDVDDKIINKANQTGQDPFALAQKYIDDYRADLDKLNVLPATSNPRATREMEYIQNMIAQLLEHEKAYVLDGDVYYRVNTKPDYGKLSGRKIKDMAAGSRISLDDRKESPEDFALWKSAKPGEPAWESPWGKGRPGWHIECSAMNLHHLGEQIDIHGGGNDLIFPHHENEIAQTEALTGKEFARYWMHNGMVTMTGEKMSKSLGNIVTIQDFLKDHPGDVMRLWVLASNYRAPLVYGDDVIEQAEQNYKRLLGAKKPALPGAKGLSEAAAFSLLKAAEKARRSFKEAMDDDFNTPLALAHVIELVKSINQARSDGATATQLEGAQSVFKELSEVWGLQLEGNITSSADAEPFIRLLVELRQEARAQKNWALSDKIRDGLKNLGVLLEDSKEGSSWTWEQK
ncbi:MAG: cysteine--tRNA ligase [Anaerolineaceae bacterium]|nr:cysteine--tRNA ligase [Anaerolineaceae bacterium]